MSSSSSFGHPYKMNLSWLSNSVREVRKHEPGVTSSALENHWKQARDVIVKSQDPEAAITVISHFNQMISLLRVARDDGASWLKCKEFWMKNRCSDKAIKWLYDLGAQRCDKDDLKLVHALQSLLELASEDGQLLGYFISGNNDDRANDLTPCSTSNSSSDNDHSKSSSFLRDGALGTWDGVCSLSTLLLELCISVDSKISDAARKSFVLLIQLASKHPELESSISQEARLGVTNMTISGLSACFAQLPTFTPATTEQLQPFIEQLHFVDSVVRAATDTLSSTIADCFSKNFLYAVILPALTQDEGSRSLHARDDQNDYARSVHEEIAVVTSYLQIVCENITHPLLIRSLIAFVLNQLLTTLLHRMNHPSTAVTIATLSLLNVLLEFYCEDLWYEMVLRYLMPQNHLMVAQRFHRLPEVDFQEAALRFVSLLPTSVTDMLSGETVSYNFLQYVHGEMIRWCAIDGISHPPDAKPPEVIAVLSKERENTVTATTSCSLVDQKEAQESTKSSSDSSANPVFPTWKYKYDGTDKWEGSCPPKSLVNLRTNSITSATSAQDSSSPPQLRHQNVNDVSEDVNKSSEAAEEPPPVVDPLSEDRFTTVSLQGGANSDEMNSIGIGMSESSFDSELHGVQSSSNGLNSGNSVNKRFNDSSVNDQSDGYSSMESGGVQDSVASFGPFVDCLFNHLTNFSKLEPDVILMVTELVSTLTASRIPLISSLFLDQNLTLQPSFRSFLLILNRVRLEFDKSIRSQQQLVSEVWGQLTREQVRLEHENGSTTSSFPLLSDSGSFSSTFGENFTENLRSKLNNNSLFTAMTAALKRKSGPVSSSSTSGNASVEHNSTEAAHSSGNQGYRYMAGRPGSAETRRGSTQEINRLLVTRAIYFTHWLLELSAISSQLCWRRGDL